MENVMYYKDRGRSLCLIKAGTAITKAYERRINRYGNTMTLICILLRAAVVAICVMMRIILKKGQRQLAVLKNMKRMNAKMQTLINEEKKMKAELEQSNRLLAKEISDRDSHFMDVYLLITKYVSDVEKYKKAVCNMIVCGKTDKARRELSSSSQNEKYLAEFYAQFDRAFLSMHPDFVERMNGLLRPECAITTPQPYTLTPELRIYALVSMGIKDSVSIAEFLNYSPQTIYNYRLRIRHCASIPEKTFAETVAAMYNEQA